MPDKLALKGSAKTVADYFEFAINNILFQRGIYPSEDFRTVRKYALPMLVTNDPEVKAYIDAIMTALRKWIYGGAIRKLVVVIISKLTTEPVEKWEFEVEKTSELTDDGAVKDSMEVQREIQSLIRQITLLVLYLPVLSDDEYTFNVLVHTDPAHTVIPSDWCDGKDQQIEGGNVDVVQFRTFLTNIHQIGTAVTYKYRD